MDKCPYCGKELVEKYCHRTTWGVEESLYQCPDNHYHEHFAYGSTEIAVCGWMSGWGETKPKGLYEQMMAICEIARSYKEGE